MKFNQVIQSYEYLRKVNEHLFNEVERLRIMNDTMQKVNRGILVDKEELRIQFCKMCRKYEEMLGVNKKISKENEKMHKQIDKMHGHFNIEKEIRQKLPINAQNNNIYKSDDW